MIEKLRADVVDAYNEREYELGDELMRALEEFMLLQIIDNRWREHLHDMDYLREGIHLRRLPRRSTRSSPTRTRAPRCSRSS